jgi:hypothetical protein
MRIGNHLRLRLLAAGIGAALLAGGCATVDTSTDWVDIKDPAELRAIYSNKTLKGHIPCFDLFRPYVLHSKADGTGTIIVNNRQTPMTWALNGTDQVCLKWPGASPCLNTTSATRPAPAFIGVTTRSPGDMAMT